VSQFLSHHSEQKLSLSPAGNEELCPALGCEMHADAGQQENQRPPEQGLVSHIVFNRSKAHRARMRRLQCSKSVLVNQVSKKLPTWKQRGAARRRYRRLQQRSLCSLIDFEAER
jgi:hypothetical protein